MLTPILLDKSAYGAYFLFGGLALVTVGILAAYMPETRGKSLESIQEAFHHAGPSNSMQTLRRRLGFSGQDTNQRIELTPARDLQGVVSTTGLRLDVSST